MSDLTTRIHQQGDTTIFESVQDCSGHLAYAKRLHNEGAHGSKDVKHAAHLPAVLVESYCNRLGITFGEFLQRKEGHIKAMLNDPDLSGFRVWKGAV
jgi:hypothetical protein